MPATSKRGRKPLLKWYKGFSSCGRFHMGRGERGWYLYTRNPFSIAERLRNWKFLGFYSCREDVIQAAEELLAQYERQSGEQSPGK